MTTALFMFRHYINIFKSVFIETVLVKLSLSILFSCQKQAIKIQKNVQSYSPVYNPVPFFHCWSDFRLLGIIKSMSVTHFVLLVFLGKFCNTKWLVVVHLVQRNTLSIHTIFINPVVFLSILQHYRYIINIVDKKDTWTHFAQPAYSHLLSHKRYFSYIPKKSQLEETLLNGGGEGKRVINSHFLYPALPLPMH